MFDKFFLDRVKALAKPSPMGKESQELARFTKTVMWFDLTTNAGRNFN